MSLRTFHVLFVTAAALLGVVFCAWAFASGRALVAFVAASSTVALATYCLGFVRRLRRERTLE